MNQTERAALARQMGLNPSEYEKARAQRAGAAGSMSLGARPGAGMPTTNLDEALDRDRLCRAFGIKPEAFAKWKADQLQLAADREDDAPPVRITPTAEERATYERARASSSIAALEQVLADAPHRATPGRTGNMKMISRALLEGNQ